MTEASTFLTLGVKVKGADNDKWGSIAASITTPAANHIKFFDTVERRSLAASSRLANCP
jgi:hypothetical protein